MSIRARGRRAGSGAMRVVVTGATGNVGTSVVTALGRDERVSEIVGLSRRPPAWNSPRTRWVAADITTAPLEEHFAGADAVVHLAWLIQPSRDERTLEATNVHGSRRVFDAAVAAGVPTLVHASSIGTYSPGPGPDLQARLRHGDPPAVRGAVPTLAARPPRARLRGAGPARPRPAGRPRRRRRRGLPARGPRPGGARRVQHRRRARARRARAVPAAGRAAAADPRRARSGAHDGELAPAPAADAAGLARHGAADTADGRDARPHGAGLGAAPRRGRRAARAARGD